MKRDNPFDIATKLFTEDNVPIRDGYMVNKILSYQASTILLSIALNKFSTTLPPWAVTPLFNLGVSKQRRRPYLQYIKKSKPQNPKLLEKIGRAFCCNTYHAQQIILIFEKMGYCPEKFFGLKKGE
jgi:hypothetical protein